MNLSLSYSFHKRTSGFTLVEALAIVAVIALLVMIITPSIMRKKQSEQQMICLSNLKQSGLSMLLYAQDFDNKFPLVEVNDKGFSKEPPYLQAYGWADAIQPYQKSTKLYHCPTVSSNEVVTPHTSGFTDYWYNRKLAGKSKRLYISSRDIVLLGEGNDGRDITDARYSKSAMPPHWIHDLSSPARRHYGRAYYVFMDGRVNSSVPLRDMCPPVGCTTGDTDILFARN